jgi:nucleoside-diphosphate-sugar epimerase
VDVLAVRLKLDPSVAERDADEVLERRRFRARSLAKSIFSRAVRAVFALAALALSRGWDEEAAVLEAAVMESRSLWNLRFEVAIASGIFAASEVVYGSSVCSEAGYVSCMGELLCSSRASLSFWSAHALARETAIGSLKLKPEGRNPRFRLPWPSPMSRNTR